MACSYMQTEWIKEMTDSLARLHPEMSRSEVEDFVIQEYVDRFRDTDVQLYNNYENEVSDTTLGEVVDWIQSNHPLIAESGVFFYPKSEKRNVNIEIIKECMLDARSIHKDEMFRALDRGDAFTAAVKDLQQGNDKKAANSGYGAEGQSSSFLFNVHSAMSVTASGRSQLSTAILCFENLFGDFVKFFDMDQFHTFINHIVAERLEWKFDTAKIVKRVPSRKEWVHRFESKFLHHTLCDKQQIELVYDSLDDELRIRTYYKCNMREFLLRNKVPTELFEEAVSTADDFIDPNKIPDSMKDTVTGLSAIVTEFVNFKYSWFRYEDRARYQKRSVVIVSDTDSTFVHYSNILNFVIDNVLAKRLYKSKKAKKMYRLKVLNVLSCFTSDAIADTLWNYLSYVNVAEEDRKHIKMKNEFYYSRVIVTYAKKSYIGLLLRKEQHLFEKPKMDVKGVNFFKSTASEGTSKFIYDAVLMGQLLQPKDDQVSLSRTYRTIFDFKEKMKVDIANGDMDYLKKSIKVKSPDAYATPFRINSYKAVFVWNYVMPDKDRIELPGTVIIVKVKLKTKRDLAALAPWPEIYEKLINLYETDSNFGDHTKIDPKTGKERKVRGAGINAIALPGELEEVPDWVLSVIDVETLINDNMRLFVQLNRPLGLSSVSATHNGASQKYYSNVVRV